MNEWHYVDTEPTGKSQAEKQMLEDADRIFTAITSGHFESYYIAEMAVMQFWAPDLSISRAGISLALKRLKKFYQDYENYVAP